MFLKGLRICFQTPCHFCQSSKYNSLYRATTKNFKSPKKSEKPKVLAKYEDRPCTDFPLPFLCVSFTVPYWRAARTEKNRRKNIFGSVSDFSPRTSGGASRLFPRLCATSTVAPARVALPSLVPLLLLLCLLGPQRAAVRACP